jgi:hypothetical protein
MSLGDRIRELRNIGTETFNKIHPLNSVNLTRVTSRRREDIPRYIDATKLPWQAEV